MLYKFLFFISDLLEFQRRSFYSFLNSGLGKHFSGLSAKFLYEHYKILPPTLNIEESIFFSQTYCCNFYFPIKLEEIEEIKWLCLGTLPLLTRRGHFIINGTPRIVLGQIVRNPGIYFNQEMDSLYAEIISRRGPWIRFDISQNNEVWISSPQTEPIPIVCFFKDFQQYFSDKDLNFNNLNASDCFEELKNTKKDDDLDDDLDYGLDDDPEYDRDDYMDYSRNSNWDYYSDYDPEDDPEYDRNRDRYLKYNPNRIIKDKSNLVFEDDSDNIINDDFSFFKSIIKKKKKEEESDFEIYLNCDLGRDGRDILNQKLNLSIKTSQLTPIDLISVRDVLLNLSSKIQIDDIDNLKNRRLKTLGELIQDQFERALHRLKKEVFPTKKVTIITRTLKEFFHSNQLSQYLDQSNPLAEITHKRRLYGVFNKESVNIEMRGIHASYYGRICPIETPEGKNAGLVNSLTTAVLVNKKGLLETPFVEAYKEHCQNQKKLIFYTAEDQRKKNVFFNHKLPKAKNVPVSILKRKNFQKCALYSINLLAHTPQQFISIATTCIPFIEHNDANRALMGSNMQRQALPLLSIEQPTVVTVNNYRIFTDLNDVLTSENRGLIFYVSNQKIQTCYNLEKNKILNFNKKNIHDHFLHFY